MASAPYRMQLLGPPSLVEVGGGPIKLRTRKQLALLARLAWEAPRPLSRAYLVDLFWPQAEARAARHSLAQALSAIRAALGSSALVVRSNTVALAGGLVSVDVRAPDLNGRLPPGEVFEGFDLPDAPAFEQWRDRLTAATWPVVRDAVVQAIGRAKSIGRYRDVEELGLQLVNRDPLCEAGVEARMQGRALAGDRIGALAVYDEYAARLKVEVGAEPGFQLTRAAENLRRGVLPRGDRRLQVGGAQSGGREVFKPVPLIGREEAYRELHGHWSASQRGEPRQVVIVGEAGVGKTVLAMTLAAAAHAEGAAVARVQLHETERTAPYALLSELVRQVLRYPGAAGAPGEALSELSRICARVRVAFPGVAEAPPATPETVHLRLTEALLRLLDAVVEEQPVLLLVDDLHLADDASVVVLQRASRRLEARPVMVCYTARDVELTTLLPSGEGAQRESGKWYWRQRLAPLAERDARVLVRERLLDVSAEARAVVEDRVVRQARGNPLALEMLLLDWRTHGSESLVFAADAFTGGNVEPWRIPETIRGAVERQRMLLGEGARQVLDVAVVLGHRLLDLEMYEALGASPLQVAEASRQLLAAGIWTDAGAQLDFRNELIRTHAYVSIPQAARAALHRRVVGVLGLRKRAEVDPALWLELAWHYWRADERGEAITHATEGAEQCLRTFAPRTAERVATDFLAESISESERSRFRYVLGRALAMQSRLRDAERLLRDASRDELLDRAAQTDARLRLADLLIKGRSAAGSAEALSHLTVAMEAADRLNEVEFIARAYRLSAHALIDADREGELEVTKSRLEGLVRGEGRRVPEAHLALAFVDAHVGGLIPAYRRLRRAIELFEEARDIEGLAYAHNGLGVTLHRLGRWAESRAAFEESNRRYSLLGNQEERARTLSHIGAVDLITAKYERSMGLLRQALDLLAPAERARFEIEVQSNLLLAALCNADRETARTTMARITATADAGAHWEVRLAAALAEADYCIVFGSERHAWPLIRMASDLATDREHRVIDLEQYVRLETLRLLRAGGTADALNWLHRISARRCNNRVSTLLLIGVLRGWLEWADGTGSQRNLQAALTSVAESGALGIIDELHWCGFTAPPDPIDSLRTEAEPASRSRARRSPTSQSSNAQ